MGGTFGGYQTTPEPESSNDFDFLNDDKTTYAAAEPSSNSTYLGGFEMPNIERTTDLWGSASA